MNAAQHSIECQPGPLRNPDALVTACLQTATCACTVRDESEAILLGAFLERSYDKLRRKVVNTEQKWTRVCVQRVWLNKAVPAGYIVGTSRRSRVPPIRVPYLPQLTESL